MQPPTSLIAAAAFASAIAFGFFAIGSVDDVAVRAPDPVPILRILSGPSERFPTPLKKRVKENAGLALVRSLRLANTQYSLTPDGGLWLVGAQNQLCLIQAVSAALECRDTTFVRKHGLALGVFSAPPDENGEPHSYVVLGVAPDWASKANLRIGRARRSIRIHENAFSAHAKQPVFLDGFE